MSTKSFIRSVINEYLDNVLLLKEGWYHGTPDSRELEKTGGFISKTMSVDYIENLDLYTDVKTRMEDAYVKGDMNLYHKLLDEVSTFIKTFTYNKPLFLSDKSSIAKTYADPRRAFDYQTAIEKVYEVEVDCSKVAKIMAIGDRFRFIGVDKVKKGFIDSGVSKEEIDRLVSMFNYYVKENKGIKTDVIAAIGNWLGFDCIDVIGVLDAYHGGNTQSTVRMVLDPTKAKIKRD